MSGHFFTPLLSLSGSLMAIAGALSARHAWLRRPIGLAVGMAIIALGVFLPPAFAQIIRWALIASGVLLTVGAALNWLPTEGDDAPLRPASGRALRHFGEAP